MSPRRAAIGSRPRPTSSSPSRRPSPARSACSACCPASRARWKSSASAPTGSRRRRCRASPTCCAGPSPEVEPAAPGRRRTRPTRASSSIVAAVAQENAGGDRPHRPGPRLGRRHRAPAWPGRRLRRPGRGGRQGRPARQDRQPAGRGSLSRAPRDASRSSLPRCSPTSATMTRRTQDAFATLAPQAMLAARDCRRRGRS